MLSKPRSDDSAPTFPTRTNRPTTVYYRFEVTDPRTGETYGITLSDEGVPVVAAPSAAEFDQCFDVAWGGPEETPKLVAKTAG